MTVQEDIEIIRAYLNLEPTFWVARDALDRLEKTVEELTNAARNAIGALIAEPEPEYEYGVRYNLSEEAHGPGKSVYMEAPSYESAQKDVRIGNGHAVIRRVKAGPWEEVEA